MCALVLIRMIVRVTMMSKGFYYSVFTEMGLQQFEDSGYL